VPLTIQLLTNGLIIIVILVWVGYRQLTWRAVDAARMWRMPIILGIVGLALLATTSKAHVLTGVDIAVLLVELIVGLGLGAAMGMLATFRPMTADGIRLYREAHAGSRRPVGDVTLQTRTGWLGIVLWIVLIAVRVGVDVLAGMAGSTLAASTGVILLMVGANRLARVAVILYRANKVAVPVL
jgi:hypothetical protein